VSATTTPEASANFRSPDTAPAATPSGPSPVSNNLLLEGLLLHRTERLGVHEPECDGGRRFHLARHRRRYSGLARLVPIIDSSTGIWSHGNFLQYNNNWVPNFFYRGAASYVTGGHQFKVGFSNSVGYLDSTVYNFSPYSFITNIVPGAPVHLIVENVRPLHTKSDQNYDLGVFAQDRWTRNRVTLNLGVRYDTYKASAPPQHMIGATPLTPNRPDVDFPYTEFNRWQDITPRLGLSWDVNGNGKTAVKVSLNKYLQSQTGRQPRRVCGRGRVEPDQSPRELDATRLDRRQRRHDSPMRSDQWRIPDQSGHRRHLSTVHQSEFRAERSQRAAVRSRPVFRMGQAAVQLGVRGQRAA
jgi:hypothetical protein